MRRRWKSLGQSEEWTRRVVEGNGRGEQTQRRETSHSKVDDAGI